MDSHKSWRHILSINGFVCVFWVRAKVRASRSNLPVGMWADSGKTKLIRHNYWPENSHPKQHREPCFLLPMTMSVGRVVWSHSAFRLKWYVNLTMALIYEALDMISCLVRDQAIRSGQSVRSKILWPILLFRSISNEMVDTRHLNSCHTRRLFCSHLRPIEPSTLYHLWVETSADWKILQTRTQPWHL